MTKKLIISFLVAVLWLFGDKSMVVRELDSYIYKSLIGEHDVLLLNDGENVPTKKQTLEHQETKCPKVGMIVLDRENASANFAALPLGPQDFSVLLNKLKEHGVETVGISSPLTWEKETGSMGREIFCRVMNGIPNAAVGLRGRTAALADFTPLMLRDTAIPDEQVEGDPTGLPIANKALPNGMTETPDALHVQWAPDWLQDEPLTQKKSSVLGVSFPLLMRWNGETIPTLPLRLAMMRNNISPKDIHVKIGKELKLGNRTLPLDEHGRTILQHAETTTVRLADLFNNGKSLISLGKRSCAMIEQPGNDIPGDQERLELLAATLSEAAGELYVSQEIQDVPVSLHALRPLPGQRAPIVWLASFLCLIALFFIVPRFPAFLRWCCYFALAAWIGRQAVQAAHGGFWFSVSAAFGAWALAVGCSLASIPKKKGIFSRSR